MLRKRLEAAGLRDVGHLARRAPRRDRRAAATTRSTSPRSSTRSSSRGPSGRRRCSASSSARRSSAAAAPQTAAPSGERDSRRRRRDASRRGRAPAAARHLRGALPRSQSPSRQRARVRGRGHRSAARRSGIEVDEDDAGAAIGGDAGNLLARIAGRGDAQAAALRAPRHRAAGGAGRAGRPRRRLGERQRGDPRRRQQGGGRGDAGARAAARARRPPAVGVELLFTVGEEIALRGAKEFDVGAPAQHASATPSTAPPRSARSSSPRRPTTGIAAELRGHAAHAGLRPEHGRSAIVAAARRDRRDAARAGSTPRRPRTSA